MVQQSGQITFLNPVLLRKKTQGVAREERKSEARNPKSEIRNKPELIDIEKFRNRYPTGVLSTPDLNFEFVGVSKF
jgi:hypothetical protein